VRHKKQGKTKTKLLPRWQKVSMNAGQMEITNGIVLRVGVSILFYLSDSKTRRQRLSAEDNLVKLFKDTIYCFSEQARVFVRCMSIQPGLMFAGKARGLPDRSTFQGRTPGLTLKH